MSELSDKYREIMNEIENNITNEKDLNFVKNKVSEMSMIFIDIIDRMNEIVEEKVSRIEQNQEEMNNRLNKVQSVIDKIEKDIYDDDFEIEVACPYCNNEFFTTMSDSEENEIKCPRCHNMIELDFNANFEEENQSCSGNCHLCGGCGNDQDDDEFEEDD